MGYIWDLYGIYMGTYPLVMTNNLLLKMAIEIVDLPSYKMVIFHSYVNVYQRILLLYFWIYMVVS
jgi:antibiotic biosynthesis monooxygenase (ABM) superfamily enzyme